MPRSRTSCPALLVVGLVAAVLTVAGRPSAQAAERARVLTAATPGQVVVVQAASPSSTTARISWWQMGTDHGYHVVGGPYPAFIGRHGLGRTHEGAAITPAGVFSIPVAFGRAPNPGTALAYFQTTPRDWWDELPSSPDYNRHVVATRSPGGASENLWTTVPAYTYAAFIGYNIDPVVRGAGSAFFVHVSLGVPTAGCVALAASPLVALLRFLNPAQHPVISLGVGTAATAVLARR